VIVRVVPLAEATPPEATIVPTNVAALLVNLVPTVVDYPLPRIGILPLHDTRLRRGNIHLLCILLGVTTFILLRGMDLIIRLHPGEEVQSMMTVGGEHPRLGTIMVVVIGGIGELPLGSRSSRILSFAFDVKFVIG